MFANRIKSHSSKKSFQSYSSTNPLISVFSIVTPLANIFNFHLALITRSPDKNKDWQTTVFTVAGPITWNSITETVRSTTDVGASKNFEKTHRPFYNIKCLLFFYLRSEAVVPH